MYFNNVNKKGMTLGGQAVHCAETKILQFLDGILCATKPAVAAQLVQSSLCQMGGAVEPLRMFQSEDGEGTIALYKLGDSVDDERWLYNPQREAEAVWL